MVVLDKRVWRGIVPILLLKLEEVSCWGLGHMTRDEQAVTLPQENVDPFVIQHLTLVFVSKIR